MKRVLVAGGLLAALMAGAGEASAQTGTARGKVLDDKGQSIAEAEVTIEYLGGVTRKLNVKTSKRGEYTQVGLAPGMYKITAAKDGYQGSFIEVRVQLGDPTYVPDLKLMPRGAGGAGGPSDKAAEQLKADFKVAADLMQAGRHAEAEAAFKTLAAANPTIPEIHYNLGHLASVRKDWPAAEAAFLKAIELKPNYGEAYVALARAHRESGHPEKGLEVLTKAAAHNQNDAKVQFNLGVEYLNSGRSEEAQAAFQKAAELDPGNAESYYHLGTLAVGQNKVADAVAHLEKYLSMTPSNAQNVATAQALLQALKPKK